MKPEWMPVNPCDTCAEKPCSFGCMPYAGYYDSIKAQRKLLEYLIEWSKTNPLIMHGWVECHAVHQDRLQAMLKEASQ